MKNSLLNFGVRIIDPKLSSQQIDNIVFAFRHQLRQELGLVVTHPVASGSKNFDPLLFGMITLTIIPTVLTKTLEFLHSWAMRRENRHLKIKIQTANNASFEIEVPQTTSPEELQKWIDLTQKSLLDSLHIKPNKR